MHLIVVMSINICPIQLQSHSRVPAHSHSALKKNLNLDWSARRVSEGDSERDREKKKNLTAKDNDSHGDEDYDNGHHYTVQLLSAQLAKPG